MSTHEMKDLGRSDHSLRVISAPCVRADSRREHDQIDAC